MQRTDLSGLSEAPPAKGVLTQDKFDRGVITLIDESKLPRNALKEAVNTILAEDGAPMISPGVDWYGTAPNGMAIDGGSFFVTDVDAIHLLVVCGGTIFRSVDNGANWATCTGATFTSGKKVGFLQVAGYMFMYDGWDNIIRYNGTTTLSTYTPISAPAAGLATKTGLAGTAYTQRYRVSAVNDIGYTEASVAATVQTDRTRDGYDVSNKVTFTWGAVTGAIRYDIYTGNIAGEEVYIDSVDGNASTTYIDDGRAVEQITTVAPDSNTTQGPRVGDMALIGVRIMATADRDFKYRVWISGAGRYVGYFSSAYDATYIDLQKGGQYKPVKIVDYRDGKGSPLATVWCDSADGRGCIWQGTVDSISVGDQSFPVPNFYKLPGSRGTNAPNSVVNVLNDYMYFNQQAFFNLGSRAQYLNLLSTDESSANIRPTVKRISQSAAPGIASYFADAKVYFSVPYNSTTNNATAIYDTERKAWLPEAFDIGFERFFAFTEIDTNTGNKTPRLLAWKTGDTKLSEINDSIRGNYGVAKNCSIVTGLRHVNERNRFEFMWVEEAEVEFAQPRGTMTVELSGITREDGYKLLGEPKRIAPSRTKKSWTTQKWSTHKWTDITGEIVSYSEPSMKRYFNVSESLNAYQYRIQTNTLDAQFILRTLQINGTPDQGGKPPEWEIYDN